MSGRRRVPVVGPNRSDDLHARWMEAGMRLQRLDPARFERVLALAESYMSVYSNEDEDTFLARLRLAAGAQVVN